ncbi:PAS domain S-box-containing protein/diguanylate cyclase (GGDEF) domain-containing protein [Atopomonas hussainii]|uniref:diguanylate cyclase n=1 Tax=Atopomonas hussainii TaxID=1429083 RepID=A0A1H7I3I7_9GAMM|nr:diguanylate cyclase [Atopomonas hussainii]SEK56402.1 PAS domain S-box-containing protein/diguanylate cyclase (GGDEF) domain-containing protein [Atopomonas hussainii]
MAPSALTALIRLSLIALLATLIAASGALAWQAQQSLNQRLEQQLLREGHILADSLQRRLRRHEDELTRLLLIWHHHQGMDQEEWELHARSLLDSQTSLVRLIWVTPELTVRWPVQEPKHQAFYDGQPLPRDLPLYAALFRHDYSGNEYVLGLRARELHLIRPINAGQPDDIASAFSGALVSSFDVDELVNSLLDDSRRELLAIELHYRSQPVFAFGTAANKDEWHTFAIPQHPGFELRVSANTRFLQLLRSPVPELIFISGSLLSLLLFSAALFTQKHYQRRNEIEQFNQQLQDEISQRSAAEEQLALEDARLNLILELTDHSHDGLIVHNLTQNIALHINSAAYRMLGYQSHAVFERLLCQHPDGILPDFQAWLKMLRSLSRQGLPRVFQLNLKRHDGSDQPVEISAELLELEGISYLVAAIRDNSARLKLEHELQELTQRDGLTGLYNRRHFDEELEREWRRAQRSSSGLGLLMIDVDHFKAFNDHFGHQAGDDALRLLANTLRASLQREGDQAFRYGGEELAVILAGATEASAITTAELLHRQIADLHIQHPHSHTGQLTISIGLSWEVPPLGFGSEQLVKHADKALYAAKEEGRNRTCRWPLRADDE